MIYLRDISSSLSLFSLSFSTFFNNAAAQTA